MTKRKASLITGLLFDTFWLALVSAVIVWFLLVAGVIR